MCPPLNASNNLVFPTLLFIADMEERVDVTEGQLGATEQEAASDPLLGAEAFSSNQSQPESVWDIETLVEQQQQLLLPGPAPGTYLSGPSEDNETEEVEDKGRGTEDRDEGTELGESGKDSVQQVQPVPSEARAQPQIFHVAPVLQASQTLSSCTLPQRRRKLDGSQVGE